MQGFFSFFCRYRLFFLPFSVTAATTKNQILGEWVYLGCKAIDSNSGTCDDFNNFINDIYLTIKFYPDGIQTHSGHIALVKKYATIGDNIKVDVESSLVDNSYKVRGDLMTATVYNGVSNEKYELEMARKGSPAASNAPGRYVSSKAASAVNPGRNQSPRSTQQTTARSPAEPLFGVWKRSACELWQNGAQLNLKCSFANEDILEFKKNTMRRNNSELGVEYSSVNNGGVQTMLPNGENLRFYFESPNTIFSFINDSKNNRQVRVIYKKEEDKTSSITTSEYSNLSSIPMQPATAKEKVFLKKLIKFPNNANIFVGRADFNDDQQEDYLVRIESPEDCGSGGCTTNLIINGSQPLVFNTNLTDFNQFSLSSKSANGVKNIIPLVNGNVVVGEKRGTPMYGKVFEYEFAKQN